MNTPSITLQQVSYSHPDFLHLCNELDQFLNQAIGGEYKREKYKKYNHLDTMDYVIIAYDGQYAAGNRSISGCLRASI